MGRISPWVIIPALAVLVLLSTVYYYTYMPQLASDENVVATVASPLASSVTNTTGSRAAPTLQLLVVFSRHGSRGPIYTYPTSPYQRDDLKYWPYGQSELTRRGRVQTYQLGVKIRSLYNGFLDEIYSQKKFRANSTLFVRSMISAGQVLAGLFPPKDFQVWNKDLAWQPVPLFPTYVDHHTLTHSKSKAWCPKFHAAKKKALLKFQEEYESNLTEILDYVKPYTNFTSVEPLDDIVSIWSAMYTLWESLMCPHEEGLPLPDWTKQIYPQPMTAMADKVLRVAAVGSETQIKYLEGEIFKEVAALMKAKAQGTLNPDREMFYYSGHDYTLLGIQGILGLANEKSGRLNARTGSSLILELHKNLETDQFYVQVLYIDGSSEDLEPIVVDIPGCDYPCDFNMLMDMTEKYYDITDWEAECAIVDE